MSGGCIRWDSLWTVPILLVAALGCTASDHPTTVSVSGKITLNGGDWPKPGILLFTPMQAATGFPMRPGTAPFDEQGNFKAGTWKPGDGLMPGSYKIVVECWSVPPTMDGPPAQGHVPPKYQTATTTDLTLEIEPNSKSKKLALDVSG